MPSIQIKDVPEEVHRVLRSRAALFGQSLQEFLLGLLTEEAQSPTLDEILDEAGSLTGGYGSLEDGVRYIREDRDSR
ncbi:MAG TPA: hypothetical protein VHV57_06115 [Acidimicrobiales bacterium]|jgi:hypothetical protein|nr:hypothetical protein [Acidimicrobiales bacterium]